jgi:hypothetical protein
LSSVTTSNNDELYDVMTKSELIAMFQQKLKIERLKCRLLKAKRDVAMAERDVAMAERDSLKMHNDLLYKYLKT